MSRCWRQAAANWKQQFSKRRQIIMTSCHTFTSSWGGGENSPPPPTGTEVKKFPPFVCCKSKADM